jgi:hypothetical protein
VYGDHPPSLGSQHPWHDPLVPADVFNPRPDAELAIAGSLAPRPEDFPFDEQGRSDYYAEVRSAAQRQLMMQQQIHHMQAAQAAYASEVAAARAAEQRRRVAFLLLSP